MMNAPLVTIIIVTYNAEKYIRACLDSIKNQNRSDIQLIVIDGASTDGTIDILNEYNTLIDYQLSETDNGIYDAMNKGVNHIKGSWVLFLGADDILETGFKQMLPELTVPNAVYYGMVNVNNVIYKDAYSAYRLAKLNICHQVIFYPAAVFKKYHYDLNYPIWADWLLNIQCWNDPNFQFIYKEHLIAKFGLDGISSNIIDTRFANDRYKILSKYLGLIVSARFFFRQLKLKLSSGRSKND